MKTTLGRIFSPTLAAMLVADDTSTHNTAVDLEIMLSALEDVVHIPECAGFF
jgi:hypothetical protein